MNTQLLLPLSLDPRFDASDFCVGDSNREAWSWVQQWPNVPHVHTPIFVIHGPSGCGKTHLGHVFLDQKKGCWLDAPVMSAVTPFSLLEHASRIIIDEADLFFDTQSEEAEEFVFHLYNLLNERKGDAQDSALLFLARTPPSRWTCHLPDLISRLKSISAIPVSSPDDYLLTQVMAKLLSDLQLSVPDPVFEYLLRHMERSFAGAQQTVQSLNNLSLQEKRPITVDLCRKIFNA